MVRSIKIGWESAAKHMRKMLTIAALAAVSGCSTYALPKYSASADTVAKLRTLAPAKVSVGSFTGEKAALTSITCRGVGPIKPPDGISYGEYLRGALRAELLLADLYDEKSPVRIDGSLSALDFSSGITDGAWQISMVLRSSNGSTLNTSTNYRFDGSFFGDAACNQTAQAGMGAVQSLIEATVRDPSFSQLVKR